MYISLQSNLFMATSSDRSLCDFYLEVDFLLNSRIFVDCFANYLHFSNASYTILIQMYEYKTNIRIKMYVYFYTPNPYDSTD